MPQVRKKQLKKGVSYEARIHRAGHPPLSKSFPTRNEAMRWAAAAEAAIDKGERLNIKAKSATIGAVLSEFQRDYRDRKGQPIGLRELQRLQALNLDLEDYAVNALDHRLVQKYLTTLKTTPVPTRANRKVVHPLYKGDVTRHYSSSSVRKLYYQLKKCLEWHAMRHGYQLDASIFKQQPVPAAWEGQRERRLVGDEEQRLLDAASRGYKFSTETQAIVRFAIETGMRSQEILKARWRDINMPGRTLNIPKEHVKTKTFRQVPLSSRAIALIETMRESARENGELTPDSTVFWPWKDSDHLARHFRRLCHRAGIEDLRFHDLRHEATSRFFERGKLSDMEIMKVTGHTQYSTLQRYVQLRPSTLADKMD